MVSELESSYIQSFSEDGERRFNFVLIGKKQNWNICLTFPEDFPFTLPKAILLDKGLIGTLAHINQIGTICMEESDTFFADYTRPKDIIYQYIEDVVRFLNRNSLKIFQDELLDELEGYFSPSFQVNSFHHATDKAEEVYLLLANQSDRKGSKYLVPVAICDRSQPPPSMFSNIAKLDEYQVINILHIPLDIAIPPPSNGGSFDSRYFFSLLTNLSAKNKKSLDKIVKGYRSNTFFYVLLSMPRTSGERTQFLLKFKAGEHLAHPFESHLELWKIEMFSVTRNTKQYLVERGGGDFSLNSKRVAVIGCGSVGSQVANMLAKAGIGELVLIDPDLLSADNIYRHHLGGRELNYAANKQTGVVTSFSKVRALSYQLQKDLPYIKVFSKPNVLASVIDDKDLKLCDVIVIAVGAPSVNLQINQMLKNNNFGDAVFCWNEAAGVGGHSIALDLHNSCYQCLYTEGCHLNAESHLSLVCSGQPISKNLTGCAGVFSPFSFLDSNRTAELAASQVLGILTKKNTSDHAVSWKGDNIEKLKITSRYSTMPLKEKLFVKKHPECRVCNDK